MNTLSQSVSSSTKTPSKWISKEMMANLCPELKLADYQLLGVNWLALLSRMQFRKASLDKKQSAAEKKRHVVNGILADEMGLGKTIQVSC